MSARKTRKALGGIDLILQGETDVLKEIVEVELNRRTVMRLEKMESDGPAQPGRTFRIIIDDDDAGAEQQITAFQKDHGMTDADLLIVRRIVHCHKALEPVPCAGSGSF